MAVEGLGLGRLVGFSPQRMEGVELIVAMAIAGTVLLCGAVIALLGVRNRATIVTGTAVILAAVLSLSGVGVGLATADDGGSLLVLTGLASLGAGLAGFDVVLKARKPVSIDPGG